MEAISGLGISRLDARICIPVIVGALCDVSRLPPSSCGDWNALANDSVMHQSAGKRQQQKKVLHVIRHLRLVLTFATTPTTRSEQNQQRGHSSHKFSSGLTSWRWRTRWLHEGPRQKCASPPPQNPTRHGNVQASRRLRSTRWPATLEWCSRTTFLQQRRLAAGSFDARGLEALQRQAFLCAHWPRALQPVAVVKTPDAKSALDCMRSSYTQRPQTERAIEDFGCIRRNSR